MKMDLYKFELPREWIEKWTAELDKKNQEIPAFEWNLSAVKLHSDSLNDE